MQTAYITGAASGLGKATAEMLVKKGIQVFIADIDETAARSVCVELNELTPDAAPLAQYAPVDVSDWTSQAKAFTQAVSSLGGRIDHVYAIAGIGEDRWLPLENSSDGGYQMPDLHVLDVDLKGAMYTIALAVQQFRRQSPDTTGRRGQIGVVVSVCGFYCVPTLPIYTTAKHGLGGFIRSYGKYLRSESIMLNGVCPNVIRTNISSSAFYEQIEQNGLLTPLHSVPDTFAALLDGDLKDSSGELFELGPNYGLDGQKWVPKPPAEILDGETAKILNTLEERGRWLQIPR